MTWIGITDQGGGWFSLGGAAKQECPPPGSLLPHGTLLVEARISLENRPQTLLAFQRAHPGSGRFSLQALPDGGIVLVESHGSDTRSAVLPCPYSDRSDIVRLTYVWNAPQRTGRLTLERSTPGSTNSADLAEPHPIGFDDLREIMTQPGRREMNRGVIFAAVSDRAEPIGPMPGLTARTPVMTPSGEVPVRKLRRGDRVVTDRGEQVPVLQLVRRTVPAHGGFHPVRLRAGYFGLNRDIVVAPYQQLIMRGSDVEYMFGSEAVLVPARHLVNNISAVMAKGPETVTFYQMLLPDHEAVMVSGCALESLFIGRLRRKPDWLAASVLAPFERSRLPEHARPAWPVLKPFEAIMLAESRTA